LVEGRKYGRRRYKDFPREERRGEERRMSSKMAEGGEYLLLDDPPHT
jgi:hypothetical protein